MVVIKASKEIVQQKNYYAKNAEIKDGVLVPKGNITVCGKRLERNCSGTYMSLAKSEYAILPNESLFRNVSKELYLEKEFHIGVNNSVWICTLFARKNESMN